jgi:AP-2 complex subunit alpha
VRDIIRESLQAIMQAASETPKNVQQNNAQNAVLFEAINLLIHLDTEHQLMMQISAKLGRFIQSRETNVRYLGLDAMTHFAARSDTLDPIKRHQNIIIGSLRDRDISVRRKGLDLLYSMCDTSNAQPIVNELLRYLQSADFSIREEMTLKIAILTEKYATDAQWYIDISLKLLAMAGDHVSDEVWQRVVQIVTNNEELQPYAARHIFEYLKTENCHDTLVKIGAYILGEFGHLIADNKGCSPIEQLMVLQTKMISAPDATRALMLSTFVKFVNLFPEIKPHLLQMFQFYSHSPDSELQQRACEYLAVATMPADDLLRTICDEMPPFSERASILLQRLHKKSVGTSERRTWLVGGKDANADKQEVLLAQQTGLKRSFTTIVNGGEKGGAAAQSNGNGAASRSASGSQNGFGGASKDLEGLDMNGHGTDATVPKLASAVHLSPDWEIGYDQMYFADEGVLYEDPQIQVGLRAEYRGHLGVIKLYFTNKASFSIGSFTSTLDNKSAPNLKIDTKSLPDSTVNADSQAQQTIVCTSVAPFSEPPTIRISYLAGALQGYTLKLPILPHRFMDPSELSAEDFFKRWRQIGGGPLEAQSTFGLRNTSTTMDDKHTRETVRGFKFRILENVDPNPKNIVGCAVLQLEKGKTGCLLRLEPNQQQKVCATRSRFHVQTNSITQMYRLTIRATQDTIPGVLLKLMQDRLARGP